MEIKRHPWKQCEFELYKDNEPTGKIYVLNDENNWCIEEWLDDEHEYDFREINIPRGYKPEYYRYRDDYINRTVVNNNSIWIINLKCFFEDDGNSKGLRPTQLSFSLNSGEKNHEVVLNEENEWTSSIKDIEEFDINDYQVEIKSNIQNTPQLLFYNYTINDVINKNEINISFKFNDTERTIQNLMNFVLETYATKDDLSELDGKITNIETTYATKDEITSGGEISRTSNNMRIRKIEREIKRLQKELDIIKTQK